MRGLGLERRREPQGVVSRGPAGRDDAAAALRERARLVGAHDRHLGERLEGGRRLDEDAAPRARADGRDGGHGRREHERARARDDQQHERPLQGDDERDKHSGDQHARREVRGKLLEHLLRARRRGLGLVDKPPELRGGVLGARRRDLNFDEAVRRDRAPGDGLALGLVDGQRLARQRRLVDCRLAAHHHAVAGHALAGAHDDDVAHD